MKLVVFVLLSIIESFRAYFIIALSPDSQLKTYDVFIDEGNVIINGDLNEQSDKNAALAYGIWTKYNPLSQIAQIGNIGLFDSNCMNIHNMIQKKSKNVNMVYYDCLDYDNKQITKNIRFKDDNGEEHFISLPIDSNQYESIWYYFQIITWPFQKLVRIYLNNNEEQIYFQELKITFPYYENQLTLTIGGGIESYFFSEKIKYSYFPGKMFLYPPSFEALDPKYYLESSGMQISEPGCSQRNLNFINSIEFGKNDLNQISSDNPNSDSFVLSGWIKIQIFDFYGSFYYKILKLTMNSQNTKLTNDNLSPFTLSYFISDSGNQIIFTTYSYTFPSVNIDFTNDPYLITTSFDLKSEIMFWHYIKVKLSKNQLFVTIIFYDEKHTQFEKIINVVQFQYVQFQLQIGNILGFQGNYLVFVASQFLFSNCDSNDFLAACDNSCLDCNGPTNQDCISCSSDSNRFFIAQLKKCDCPINTIDKQQCLTHLDLNFNIVISDLINSSKCPFGYFESEQECFLCPSIRNSQQTTCLECLKNPQTWINVLQCSTSLISIKGTSFKEITEEKSQYFTFDGNQLNPCQYCTNICQDQECINKHFISINIPQILFCYAPNNKNCYKCTIQYCEKCDLNSNGEIVCLVCKQHTTLINRQCVLSFNGAKGCFANCSYCIFTFQCFMCYPPYYLSSAKTSCKLCPIKNCYYCFEYQQNDRSKSTLYKDFDSFQSDEYTAIGCSLCYEGFNFDFNSGKCIYGTPKIKNCLRSFIDYQSNEEICIVSTIDDFNVAPQIIGCQSHIQNCEQCILTPSQIIKCIICTNGFTASFQTGQCHKCDVSYAVKCIDGTERFDYWVQLIQSFMIQFLPDKYVYSYISLYYNLMSIPFECQLGYQLTRSGSCAKYCDSDCLVCQEVNNEIFICQQCPINYYGLAGLSISQGSCLICPQLCVTCQERSVEEIEVQFFLYQNINPYFIIQSSNKFYTYQCLQAMDDDNVSLDSQTKIAKYCFNDQCDGYFEYQNDIINECNLSSLDPNRYSFYENTLDLDYCNRMGIQFFLLKVIFYCNFFDSGKYIQSNLKKSIFSLQQVQIQLVGTLQSNNIIYDNLGISNFDIVEWQQIFYQGNSLIFLNDNQPIDIIFTDVIFSGTINNVDIFLKNNVYKNLRMKNVKLIDLNLSDMIWLDYYTNTDNTAIIIENLTIQNCVFENVTLFSILQFFGFLQIQNINIIGSQFLQTTIFKYNSTTQFKESCYMNQLIITDSIFQFSTFLFHNGGQQLEINNLQVQSSTFNNSAVIMAQCSTSLTQIQIIKVNMISSFFLTADIQEKFFTKFNFYIKDFFITETFLTNSILVYVHQLKINEIDINIELDQFNHSKLVGIGNTNQSLFLYDLQCNHLTIQNLLITNSYNLSFFNIQQTQIIEISDLIYNNEKQQQKVQLSGECYTLNIITTLLRIYGYSSISLENIKIQNQFSIDHPLINIISDIFFNIMDIEIINISKISFVGNILIKKKLANIFSLLVIYSDRLSNITLKEMHFEENFFNQLTDDPSQTASSLIFIDSQLSTISFQQINCQSNGLTNSSFSFIFINSITLRIKDFIVLNSNLLDNQLWSNYYQIEVNNFNLTNSFVRIVQQIFGIQNIGGVAKIITSQMYLENANFTNIMAESRSIFDITTQGQGLIVFNNLIIENSQSSLQSNLIADGCITISSQNSILQLQAHNMFLQKINNRLYSALFTIYTSKKLNNLQFINISAVDCYSLMNQFLLAEFSQESISQLVFKNLIINNSEVGLNNYLQLIQFPSSIEILKIKSNNALFNLLNCDVTFVDIFISGILISPILILSDSQNCKVNNMRLQNIQLLYPLSVLQFTKITQIKSTLVIQNLEIINATQLFQKDSLFLNENIFIIFTFKDCFIDQIDQSVVKMNQTISALIASLNQDIILTGSLLHITGLSQLARIKINRLNIQQNICNFCYDGMVYVQQTQFSPVVFEDVACFSNIIKKYGCLQLKKLVPLVQGEQRIFLKHSRFVQNNGTIGVGIFTQNIITKIFNSIFLGNNCEDKGGAIYFQDAGNDFLIKKCFFIENSAKQGGGIYLSGRSQITNQNFIVSLTHFNKALFYSNNLVEAPDHLTLVINNKEINSNTKYENNQVTEIISIQPYQLVKNSSIYTTNLYLPSGQEISSYKLFDQKNKIFQSYIKEISLLLKNSLNEDLIGDTLDKCVIYFSNDQSNDKGISINYNQSTNKFDLGSLKVTFSPYNENNQVLQIFLACQSQILDSQLRYLIIGQTFNCQLGEFFANDQCLMCEPSYGFYSVTKNATSCSIFDETKFEKITSNQIKLKPGFWRPTYISNSVEFCFKNQEYCLGGWNVGNELCFLGHIGGLCEECDTYNTRGDGSYIKSGTQECGVCTVSFIQKLPFVFLMIWSFVAMLLTLKSNQSTSKTFARYRATTKLYEILFKLNQEFESILIKMFLNYLWIFSVIFSFNITFDFSFSAVDSISTPSASVANNLDCELSQAADIELIYLRVVSMITFLSMQILIVSYGMKIYCLITKTTFDLSIFTNSFLYLYISNQAALIKIFSSLIAIRTITQQQYIQGNVALLFYQDNHLKWVYAFILPCLIIFGVAIPLTLFLILFLNKHQFNQSQFRKHLGYLFNDYNKENQFWEQTRVIQRTIIIIFLTSFETSIDLKACLISLAVLSYQILAINRKPYIIKSLNALDIESGQIILISIFLALIKYISEQKQNRAASIISQIIVVIFLIALCLSFITRILTIYLKKYQLFVLNSIKTFTLNYSKLEFITQFISEKCNNQLMKKQQLERNYQKLRFYSRKGKQQVQGNSKYLSTGTQQSERVRLLLDSK